MTSCTHGHGKFVVPDVGMSTTSIFTEGTCNREAEMESASLICVEIVSNRARSTWSGVSARRSRSDFNAASNGLRRRGRVQIRCVVHGNTRFAWYRTRNVTVARSGCDGVMASPVEFMLADLKNKYGAQAASPAFTRLYDDEEFGHMFAVLHKKLNQHFEDINDRAKTTHHYWADNSRDLIVLFDELNQDVHELKRAGTEATLADTYQRAIERCEPWLSRSGGSTVPDDFEPFDIVEFEPVFSRPATTVRLQKQQSAVNLKMVGEGSYANVFSYLDPDYGKKFAVKRAKRGISERDLHRFKQEFEVLKRLSFPYVVEVYQYDDERNEYRMEFCDETLREYVSKRNGTLLFSSRKCIALQFLYGINYIHSQGLLHRDISLQNVLLKVFDGGAILVKLSDFGLVKDKSSDFTRTKTEMRGTIRDPLLDSFKDYGVLNEMYSIGWVLSYIFTGRDSLKASADEVSRIVQKCVAHNTAQRYRAVLDLIADVERLEVTPIDTPA